MPAPADGAARASTRACGRRRRRRSRSSTRASCASRWRSPSPSKPPAGSGTRPSRERLRRAALPHAAAVRRWLTSRPPPPSTSGRQYRRRRSGRLARRGLDAPRPAAARAPRHAAASPTPLPRASTRCPFPARRTPETRRSSLHARGVLLVTTTDDQAFAAKLESIRVVTGTTTTRVLHRRVREAETNEVLGSIGSPIVRRLGRRAARARRTCGPRSRAPRR